MAETNQAHMELRETADGFFTAFNTFYGEHYHNLHGAWQETLGLYGRVAEEFLRLLNPVLHKNMVIADVGFGLGYNFLLAFQMLRSCAHAHKSLFSFEQEKLSQLPLKKFNYPEALAPAAYIIDKLEANNELSLENVQIQFMQGDLRRNIFRMPDTTCQIWLWDPFSAAHNPEMWSQDLFRIVFEKSAPNAILVTYAKSGYVRRALAKGGFSVFCLFNLGGKKEATLAFKGNPRNFTENCHIPGLKPVNWLNYQCPELTPLRDPLLKCEPGRMLACRSRKKFLWENRLKSLKFKTAKNPRES